MRLRKWPLIGLLAASLGAGAVAHATSADGADAPPPRASIENWRWAPRSEPPKPPKEESLPRARNELGVSEPEIGDDEPAEPAEPREEPPPPPPEPPPLPEPSDDDAMTRAEVLPNGVALPPLEAPPEIRAVIEAGNQIARTPYRWGGGHGKWQDTGYDCSGSVSYALARAGLVSSPMASGPYMGWGKPGPGKWVTIYTNPGHMFMVVAVLRFDTSGSNFVMGWLAVGSRFYSCFTYCYLPGF